MFGVDRKCLFGTDKKCVFGMTEKDVFGADEKVEIRVTLSDVQEREVEQLVKECERTDRVELDFFMEQEWNEILDCPCFFLFYKGGQLICAVSAFLADREAEISAVTRKEWRGKGVFSKVLREGVLVLREYGIQGICFRIADENKAALQILEHWGFERRKADCLMAWMPEEAEGWLECKRERIEEGDLGEVRVLEDLEIAEKKQVLVGIHASAFECLEAESEWIFESSFSEEVKLWGCWREGQVIGICFVSETKREYFLSGVSICKKEQRKGYGEQFLRELLLQLQRKERKAVFLQVSGENERAVRLYRKIGFSVRQRLTTYRMDWEDCYL